MRTPGRSRSLWKRQRPVIQPERRLELGWGFPALSSSQESCWERKDTHFSGKRIPYCSHLPSSPEAGGPRRGESQIVG